MNQMDIEERLITRWSASRFLIAGVVVAGLGYLPLQLYILFGPEDGNPIGLGLFAIIMLPAAMGIFAIGIIKLIVACFLNRKN
jgi:hypothetical protein